MVSRKARRSSPLLTERLNGIASEFIGDGKGVDAFFVTDGGDVDTITFDYETARVRYEVLAARRPLQECALEARSYGVVASVEPAGDEPNDGLRYDAAPRTFRK